MAGHILGIRHAFVHIGCPSLIPVRRKKMILMKLRISLLLYLQVKLVRLRVSLPILLPHVDCIISYLLKIMLLIGVGVLQLGLDPSSQVLIKTNTNTVVCSDVSLHPFWHLQMRGCTSNTKPARNGYSIQSIPQLPYL